TPVIPDTVQTIGADAFWRADITGVTIPAGVREIGPSAFYESTALTAVDIPGSVARIDDSAFSGCTGLTSVTLHEGLQVIGDGAFRECEGLTSLTCRRPGYAGGHRATTAREHRALHLPGVADDGTVRH
ncbi:MAG: leucine-rich repeat domain-containing protein, partial [Oscillospiraceae bacterium]